MSTAAETVRQLVIKSLEIEEIDLAYPLVQMTQPDVDLDHWRAFARAQIQRRPDRTSGIQSVVTEQNYIAGLSSYRVRQDLCHGPALVVEQFMALDLFDRASVVHALAEFLEDLGRRHGCACVHTRIPDLGTRRRLPSDCAASILRTRGHTVRTMGLCKTLGPPPNQA